MQSDDVQLHSGGISEPYKEIARIEAKLSRSSTFSADPTLDEINAELRRKACEMYANAVLNVQYDRGMSLFSYGTLKAWGVAVVIESDEVTCTTCAEKIKRLAIKCRFCGTSTVDKTR